MLKNNLVMLRNLNGFTQEQVAEKIGISRQAYSKWESGATVPDIEKCSTLADLYGVSVDSLIKTETEDRLGIIPPAPKGKNIWGTVSINDRGQIIIPKDVREKFGLISGTRLVVLSDEEGIALITADRFESQLQRVMELLSNTNKETCDNNE